MNYSYRLLLKRTIWILLLAFVYSQTAQFSRILASTPNDVTPVWPPDGFATAAVLLFGNWIFPGVLVGSFLANFWAFINTNNSIDLIISLVQVLGIAAGTTIGTLLGSFLLRKSIGNVDPFKRLNYVTKFLFFTGMIGPIVNATAGITSLTLGGKINSSAYLYTWLTWWISNVAGIFIFTPALLIWGQFIKKYYPHYFITRKKFMKFIKLRVRKHDYLKITEAILLTLIVIWISKNAFWGQYYLEYMLIPCLVWATFRFGKIVSTSLIVIIASIAVFGTVRQLGVFARPDLNESLILLQCFIGVIVLTTLVLNAILAEKENAIYILQQSQQQLLNQSYQLTQQNIELEEAKQNAVVANRTKSKFLTNMSHELRTPLNGILGITQLLKDSPKLTQQEKKDIKIIEQSGLHLLTLINDVLDISKIEAGKLELENKKFNFSDFLEGIVEICRYSASEKICCFNYQFNNDLPVIINGDEKRLRQILLNLLGNAIKFTETGEVLFKVSLISQEKKDTQNDDQILMSKIKFEVRDTGVGIPAEKLGSIFLPFEQVGETRLKSQGTGLGLPISQRIANKMGSEIKVESTLGQGSIFSLELELETILNQPETGQNQVEFKADISEKIQLNILVAEDNLINQKVITKLFKKLGYTISIAVNGIEVLKLLQENVYDVIFMDIQMPKLDGIETTKKIHAEFGKNSPYIIALTANAMLEDKENCLAVGMDDFITKPVKLETISQAIKLMQERQAAK